MTVCVAVCVNDGIVFAADSAATLIGAGDDGKSQVLNVYRHGNKVFNLYKGLSIGAMTAGMASIGDVGIHTLAKDLRKRLSSSINKNTYSVQDVSNLARDFLYSEKYKSAAPLHPPHCLEFWVGGYSSDNETPELWKLSIRDGECEAPERLNPTHSCGLWWGGSAEPIERLILGYDSHLREALISSGVEPITVDAFLRNFSLKSNRFVVAPSMPIQDAIDLAEYLVDITKSYYRFLPGADIVGGDTDIAVITRHERFKWIKRKHFYPQHLNLLETDHDHG